MQIIVNGKICECENETCLGALMLQLGYVDRSVAVVIDGKMLPRSTWNDKLITDGLRLEVVSPMQGG